MKFRNSLLALVIISFLSLIFFSQNARADLNSGLAAYYDFDGNADDKSGNENHAAVYGATAANDQGNNPANAYDFDGTDDYVSAPHDTTLNLGTGDFSVCFWIKPHNVSGYKYIVDKRGPTYIGFLVYMAGDGASFQIADNVNGYQNFDTGYHYTANAWTHICYTVDRDSSTGGKLYVNGTQNQTFNPTGRPDSISNSAPLLIGGGPNSAYDFDGLLDEVRIYNRAITSTEAADIYNLTAQAVRYVDTVRLQDVNSNGYEEIASLLRDGNNTVVRIIDSHSNSQIGLDIQFFNSANWIAKRVNIVDANNDGHEDIAVMATNASTGEAVVKIYNYYSSQFISPNIDLTQ
jgi:hypothetical protein